MNTIRARPPYSARALAASDRRATSHLPNDPSPTPRKEKGVPEETIGTPSLPTLGTPVVYQGFPMAADLTQSWGELQEVLDWWRERKQTLTHSLDESRKHRRQTYHVEERFINAIRRAADLERIDLAEIVNRAFARYFNTD